MSEEARQKAWWDDYAPDLADWFSDYIWLESRADHIQMYDNVLFPGYIKSPQCDRLVEPYDRLENLCIDPKGSAELISAPAKE